MARPKKYDEGEQPYGLTIRIPRDLFNELKRYAAIHRQTLTEVLLDGLRLRLDTPTDPRDIIASQDITVMQDLERLIDARIAAQLAQYALQEAQHAFTPPTPAQVSVETPSAPLPQDGNAVMQQHPSPRQEKRRSGRRPVLRQPILDLLRQHPEGLSAVELKVYLKTEKHIGDTLTGMVRNQVITKQSSGNAVRYFAPST